MKALQVFAVLLLLGAVIAWVGAGANRGWTKTSVPVKTVDEVTGLDAIVYQKRFVPGIDFLGVAAGSSATLFGISVVFRRKGGAKS